MGGERPRWISNLISIFKKTTENVFVPHERGSRFVKNTEVSIDHDKVTVDELHVELTPDQPDDVAAVIARTFRTGRTVVGNYNPKTGEFEMKDVD